MGLNSLRPSSTKKEISKSNKRKLEKKLSFYAKVKDTVASLSAKKSISKKRQRSRQKKLKAYDLSALSEFLPELSDASQLRPLHEKLKLNSKSRLKLVEKEGKQLKAVLNHPAFQLDPLAAIQKHLENTQPLPESSQKKRPRKTEKKKSKRKQSKVSTGVRSMEV